MKNLPIDATVVAKTEMLEIAGNWEPSVPIIGVTSCLMEANRPTANAPSLEKMEEAPIGAGILRGTRKGGNMNESFIPQNVLEKVITGTTLNHVNVAVQVFDAVSADEIFNRTTRLIFKAAKTACDGHLLETARPNVDVVCSILQSWDFFPEKVSRADINECSELGCSVHPQTEFFLDQWQAQKEHRAVFGELQEMIDSASTTRLSVGSVVERFKGGAHNV